ncbi:MAG: AbrB/MazE/SpoVT family DNA-binding domain-containing protein [Thermotogae bacterium]|nr:AbrB/MazE/SpoVT family DNA-binding domain-containing protein [Thermotogota bacterium]MCP5465735.1 AbrB/MazE/SpoVT family DNA-binding domain-containing protein [Thermotogota bacterium]HOO73735.1 AbrB/MazE/SpoVT family DNA-binding domain-containing protein [Tepiditoga sp.]
MSEKYPDGKFMSTVKVGEKGQIVIPKGVREIFDIKPGDILLVLADEKQGIAIVKNEVFKEFAENIFKVQKNPEEAE